MTLRTLIVMRHAKAAWPEGVADIDRPLSARGERDALVAGQVLVELLPPGARVLVSPAERTRATWKLVARAFADVPEVEYAAGIYDARIANLRDVVARVPPGARCALLIGHNPGCAQLVADLCRQSDVEAFPTSAIAVFTFTGDWAVLGPARFIGLQIPRA
jgi:phosphohistidine phosphatase